MADPVKTRRYRSPQRQAQAAATRQRILQAARRLFSERGYQATAIASIAQEAGVSVDTLYAAVGRKPQILRAVIDELLGGEQASQRDYVRAVRAKPTAAGKLEVYAEAVSELVPAIGPLQEALRKAGDTDTACRDAWQALVDRRARNMLQFAEELRATGEVRPDLSDRKVADIVWATNAAEFWSLLEQRGWSPREFQDFLTDLWTRMLLNPRNPKFPNDSA